MIEEQQGDVAQMVERSLSMREVRGSIPRISTFFWFSCFYLISSFMAISNLIHELMDPDWALNMTVDIQSKQFANVLL